MRNLVRVVTAFAAVVVPVTVHAQTRCTETTRFDPPLRILRCTDGLTLEAERAATLRPVDRDGDGQLEGAEIGGSAVLVTLPTRSKTRRGGFQILTPRDCLRARHDLRRRCDHRQDGGFRGSRPRRRRAPEHPGRVRHARPG